MEYDTKLRSDSVTRLFEAVLTLESVEDCYRFFEDVCTIGEVLSLAQRFEVAELLDTGVTYNTIAERTSASSATISRVNKCLVYGADGYRRVLDRLKTE